MKTETVADMHMTEAGMDEMADEAAAADSALPNIADQTVQADSEIQESADASVNHMDGNGVTEAQTDAAIAANQSGNQASEESNDGNNQMSYQTITQVILTQYDAQGKIAQQFDSVDIDETIDKVQLLLETYQVLDWKPVDMIKSDMPYYLMELKLQDGSSVANVYYEAENTEGKTVADLMTELQKMKEIKKLLKKIIFKQQVPQLFFPFGFCCSRGILVKIFLPGGRQYFGNDFECGFGKFYHHRG